MKTHHLLCYIVLAGLAWFVGCTSSRDNRGPTAPAPVVEPPNSRQVSLFERGAEKVFANANAVVWVPYGADDVWDNNPTSGIRLGELTPPGAFVKIHKIVVELRIFSEAQFRQYYGDADGWYFQEHPVLSFKDGQSGRQLRKDIRDPGRGRVLLINARVKWGGNFDHDLETAIKIVESVRLISK